MEIHSTIFFIGTLIIVYCLIVSFMCWRDERKAQKIDDKRYEIQRERMDKHIKAIQKNIDGK